MALIIINIAEGALIFYDLPAGATPLFMFGRVGWGSLATYAAYHLPFLMGRA